MQDLATHFSRNRRVKMLKLRNDLSNLSENSAKWASNGWSFIPLNGDLLAGHEKAPALPNWKTFQHRHPSNEERRRWFDVHQFSAAGIVLGKISGIVVIDIDDQQTADAFARAMPDLTQTFTVQSGHRGLPHYYYAIDRQVEVPNMRTRKIELRSEGAYVVAPNVVIRGKRWRVVNPVNPHKLTEGDLSRLTAFIRSYTQEMLKSAESHSSSPLEPTLLLPAQLISRYKHLAHQIGRNNALFNCGCYARDRGWTADQVTDTLLQVHVEMQITSRPHHVFNESVQSRQREGLRTIASVYRVPARPIYTPERTVQLPNAVREVLLQRQEGFLARVLDGLLMAGIRIGEWFSASRIVQVLGHLGIGRNTVYQALQVSEIFTPQTPQANADRSVQNNIKQCLFDSGTNQGQNQRGRPSAYFQMPSLAHLCSWLGVQNKGGDLLTVADVRTSTAYRRALYQAHIKRAPGAYTRQWQSQRLGISARTCRRYDRQCGIKVYPRYHETPILWSNLETAVSDEPMMGRFMMDQTGRRYPENRMLAKRLLGMGRRLSLMVQGANYYQAEAPAITTQQLQKSNNGSVSITVFNAVKNVIVGIPKPALSAHLKAPKRVKQKPYNPALIDTDSRLNLQVVDRLYQTLRDLNPDQSITKKTAKAWTKTYGERAVKRALAVLKKRQNIVKNPAGFVRILLQQNRTVVLKKNDSTFQNRDSTSQSMGGWERFLTAKYGSIFANYETLGVVSNE
jgi:hypothetical protein